MATVLTQRCSHFYSAVGELIPLPLKWVSWHLWNCQGIRVVENQAIWHEIIWISSKCISVAWPPANLIFLAQGAFHTRNQILLSIDCISALLQLPNFWTLPRAVRNSSGASIFSKESTEGWVHSVPHRDAQTNGKENFFLWQTWLQCQEGEYMWQEQIHMVGFWTRRSACPVSGQDYDFSYASLYPSLLVVQWAEAQSKGEQEPLSVNSLRHANYLKRLCSPWDWLPQNNVISLPPSRREASFTLLRGSAVPSLLTI